MYENKCFHCKCSEVKFSLHEIVGRKVKYVTCKNESKEETILILVIKCHGCKRTFRDLPPFLIKNHIYTRDIIENTTTSYLQDPEKSLREVVNGFSSIICKGKEHFLSQSTLFYWIRKYGESFSKIFEAIKEKLTINEIREKINPIIFVKKLSKKIKKETKTIFKKALESLYYLSEFKEMIDFHFY